MTYLSEILEKCGSSVAGLGGSLAVILTITADLGQWVAIVGGAFGLCAGALGIYHKWQEIKVTNQELRLTNIKIQEIEKSIKQDEDYSGNYEKVKVPLKN